MIESCQERYNRYETAHNDMLLWQGLLEQAYFYMLPKNNHYETISKGQSIRNEIYDNTGQEALKSFANNLQYITMPPLMRWADLIAPTTLASNEQESINDALTQTNDLLFHYLKKSNFDLVVNEAFQEMGISTGNILLHENDIENPLRFESISTSDIALESGLNGDIENFWRKWKISIRKMKRMWPKIKLTPNLENTFKTNPDTKIDILEGFIYYPDNKKNEQNFYYVTQMDERKDLLQEYLEDSPLISFRFSRRSNETLGRGVGLLALNTIKVLNKYAEMELKTANMIGQPPYLYEPGGIINVQNTDFEINPGALIAIDAMATNSDPIRQLQYTGNLAFSQEFKQTMQLQIRSVMFANPLPALSQGPVKSATEFSLLQQNWIRENVTSFSRIISELLNPLIRKSVNVLYRKGILKDIKVNGKLILLKDLEINYRTPISQLQNQQDLETGQTYVQQMIGTYGQAGIAAISSDYNKFVAKKLNVDPSIVNDSFTQDAQAILSSVTNAVQKTTQPVNTTPAPVPTQTAALQALDQYLPQEGRNLT